MSVSTVWKLQVTDRTDAALSPLNSMRKCTKENSAVIIPYAVLTFSLYRWIGWSSTKKLSLTYNNPFLMANNNKMRCMSITIHCNALPLQLLLARSALLLYLDLPISTKVWERGKPSFFMLGHKSRVTYCVAPLLHCSVLRFPLSFCLNDEQIARQIFFRKKTRTCH